MNKHSMIFIGLDTHKEFHEVAYCEGNFGSEEVVTFPGMASKI